MVIFAGLSQLATCTPALSFVTRTIFSPSTGMLPVISTRPLSNFELTLSPDGTRVGNHRCSNLLDFNEIQTGHGFITDATKNPEIIGETSPYQYSAIMRSANSLRFYRNLNLEACLWEFTSYYDMSELLNDCGGSIGTDGQVGNTYCDAKNVFVANVLSKIEGGIAGYKWCIIHLYFMSSVGGKLFVTGKWSVVVNKC